MKRQQLFNNFWLASTTVVLVAQPAGADIVQRSAVSSTLAKAELRTRPTPIPSYLNPSSNPLQFPTRPEEVRIRGTQPITLQQAFELARRNNRSLQVAELTLERSKAALREAQAALYPTLSIGATLSNFGNAFINSTGNSTSSFSTGSNTSSSGTTTGTNTGSSSTTGTNTGNSTITGTNTGSSSTTLSTNIGSSSTTSGTSTSGTTSAATVTSTGSSSTTSGTSTSRTTAADPPATNTGTNDTATTSTTTATPTRSSSPLRTSSTELLGTVSLSYNLYTSGSRKASIRAAEEQVRYDQLGVEIQAEQLRLTISNDYYNLQNDNAQVLIYQAAVTNALASLRDAQAQEQAGIGTRFDTLRAQVQLANETQNLTNAQANQQIAQRQLAQDLSLANSVDVSAADPIQIAGLWNLSLEESLILAFKNRAELEQYLANRNIAEQNRRLALSAIGPKVSLTAEYQVADTFLTSYHNSSGGGSDEYILEAIASLTLFDGGAARASAAQSEANKAIAETNFANERNVIRFNVEQDYANLQANLANIQTSSVALEEARESLRLARLRFQAGVGTQTDVISAENDLTNSEGSRITAIVNYNKSLASIQRDVSSGGVR